jgi:hypothetical protein
VDHWEHASVSYDPVESGWYGFSGLDWLFGDELHLIPVSFLAFLVGIWDGGIFGHVKFKKVAIETKRRS